MHEPITITPQYRLDDLFDLPEDELIESLESGIRALVAATDAIDDANALAIEVGHSFPEDKIRDVRSVHTELSILIIDLAAVLAVKALGVGTVALTPQVSALLNACTPLVEQGNRLVESGQVVIAR